jgi:hypothetical protein
MKNIQFIKVNDDSTITVEYKKTTYIDIPNPDNLKGLDLIAYVTEKIVDVEKNDDFLDPEQGILDQLEITQDEVIPVDLELPELRKW